MRQVGHLPELYEDAQSEKYKEYFEVNLEIVFRESEHKDLH